VAPQRRINSWCTQCDSPTSSSERKDFVANTPHKAWSCKAVHKSIEIRQFEAINHVQAMFPKLSEAKVKGGIFTGLQIRQMLGSKELEDKMNDLERDAWQSFPEVLHGFRGRNKADNYEDLVEVLLQAWMQDVNKNALFAFSFRFF